MLGNIQASLQNSDGSTHIKTQKIGKKDYTSTVLFKEKDTSSKNELSISTIANQLSNSAIKAQEQSKNLSRLELKEHAEKIINQLAGFSVNVVKGYNKLIQSNPIDYIISW
jgi:hypothetical protein